MAINLYNTLSRSIDELKQTNDVYKIYCCGPTVYNFAHIGNFRTFLAQDVLFRLLKIQGFKTCIVRNITDIDDKTIKFSKQNNVSLSDFTKKWEKIFHEDCEKLNMINPDFEPRASEHIDDQIKIIQKLIDNGLAYKSTDNSVYFSIKKFDNYRALSRFNEYKLQTQKTDSAGEKIFTNEYDRESTSDFVLWKSRKIEDGENFWESPFGKGRPGWHIECSAMAMKYLGEEIDLHSGGIDLCFPHHENEIAQSEGSTGKIFSKHWMHITHLMVNGVKMSKSLGNLYTLQDIIACGYSAQALRYALIAGHYRQPLNFTFNTLQSAENALKKIKNFSKNLNLSNKIRMSSQVFEFFTETIHALCYDLNTPKALGAFFKSIQNIKFDELSSEDINKISEEFYTILYIFGIDLSKIEKTHRQIAIPQAIINLADERIAAKKLQDFASADELRNKINSLGWIIKDTQTGYEICKAPNEQ